MVFRKYDGSPHWSSPMRRLGEDEHGVWLGAPAGAIARRGRATGRAVDYAHVVLVPRDGWWTATFNDVPKPTEIYCDVTTPPRWLAPDEVTVVDLDLDVRRRRTGEVEVLDEDEFVAHRARYGYTGDVVEQALAAVAYLDKALRGDVEPFSRDYHHWLARVR
ncbi:hypothetical protein GCM10009681_39040 [Luedemannella helvata]|uniref:DUF402 domain-containing protein n=1 Tax=Luedemannella helvata TaxID=349315 RepID=A0ABP4WZM4_9ACTN